MTFEPPTTATQLAAWLRQRRRSAHLSQEKAAALLELKEPRNLKRWEREEKPTVPGGLELLRLMALYGVRIEPPPEGYQPADVASVIEAVVAELADLRTAILAALPSDGDGDPQPADSSVAPTPAAGKR